MNKSTINDELYKKVLLNMNKIDRARSYLLFIFAF